MAEKVRTLPSLGLGWGGRSKLKDPTSAKGLCIQAMVLSPSAGLRPLRALHSAVRHLQHPPPRPLLPLLAAGGWALYPAHGKLSGLCCPPHRGL